MRRSWRHFDRYRSRSVCRCCSSARVVLMYSMTPSLWSTRMVYASTYRSTGLLVSCLKSVPGSRTRRRHQQYQRRRVPREQVMNRNARSVIASPTASAVSSSSVLCAARSSPRRCSSASNSGSLPRRATSASISAYSSGLSFRSWCTNSCDATVVAGDCASEDTYRTPSPLVTPLKLRTSGVSFLMTTIRVPVASPRASRAPRKASDSQTVDPARPRGTGLGCWRLHWLGASR